MHSFNNIIIDLTFILLQLFMFLGNYHLLSKKILHPSVLFSMLWLSVIVLRFIFSFTILNELDPLSSSTYLIFFIGTLCFSLGSYLVTFSRPRNTSSLQPKDSSPRISFLLRLIFLAIVAVGLPLYIQAEYKLFVASQIDNFFKGLRAEVSYGDDNVGAVKYLVSLSFVVLGINLYCFLKQRNLTNRVVFITSLLIAIVYSVFATGRTFYFLIIAIYIGVSFILKKDFSLKRYAWLMISFLVLFISIGVLYDKIGNTESSLKENINSASENTASYVVASLNALDYQNSKELKPNYEGDNTFRFFIKSAQQFGLFPERKVTPLIQEFIFVPYPTNVYTFYSPYIGDFGKIYAWIMIFLFGALHTWVYLKATIQKSLRFTLYYTFLLYPLLMSFFQDQYMNLFSTWIQVAFFIESFLFLNLLLLIKWGRPLLIGNKSDAAE